MKKLIYSATISLGVLFASCDYVSNPIPEKNANLGDTTTCPTATFPTVTTHVKKLLIEDFTGHTCANCPKAATALYKIDTTYPGKIIGIAEHVGSFAAPSPGYHPSVPGSFMADYRTSAGDAYETVFTPYAIGLPEGMMNRKEFGAALNHLKFYLNWDSYVAGIIGEPSTIDLQLDINYDASTRKICCAVRDSFLIANASATNLVVVLTQDSIRDWQDSITVIKSNYLFNHILRDAITPSGAWGETVTTGAVAAGIKHFNKFAYTIPAAYNGIACVPEHCHLVAFIYNVATKEIIQSEEVKVIP